MTNNHEDTHSITAFIYRQLKSRTVRLWIGFTFACTMGAILDWKVALGLFSVIVAGASIIGLMRESRVD